MEKTIPEGYQRTEMGVIPNDWFISRLGDLGTFRKGKNIPKKDLVTEGVPCVLYGEIYTKYNHVVKELSSFIPHEEIDKTICINCGDILFAGSGETAEEIGKCFAYIGPDIAYAGGDIIIISPRDINSTFLGYLLNAPIVNNQKSKLGQGSSVVHIYSSSLKKVIIPIPPTTIEQQSIAQTLSETDSLIASLNNLITKKRNIKKGTMQQLLTGKKRLPGFTAGWEVKEVSQFGDIITGRTPPTQIKRYWNGTIPWVTPTDISYSKDISRTEREITQEGLNQTTRIPCNSILVTCIASIGKNVILKEEGACNQQINAIIPNKEYYSDFIYYLFENNKLYLQGQACITATNIISKNSFMKIIFKIPPSIVEQTAIATVLSDMDSEIESLEYNRDKYKAIKQGMMQELLMGKTRLVW